MLRDLDAAEWLDWRVLETIRPFGERRDDLRTALLAQTIVQAVGSKKADGQPYTAADFLARLDLDDRPVLPPAPKPLPPLRRVQSPEEIEARLDMWMNGSNRIFQEAGGVR